MRALPANLDAIRGAACLLLVAFHVIGPGPASGLRLAEGHGVHLLLDWLGHVRMPLFAALSGYLFAARPPTADSYRGFMAGKIRRLGIPLVTATLLYARIRWGAYGLPPEPTALTGGFLHLWFLQASLILFAGFGALAAWGRLETVRLVATGLMAAMAIDLLPWVHVLSLSGALFLAPFFAFGMIARRHADFIASNRVTIAALAIVTLVMGLSAAHLLGALDPLAHGGLAVALCGCGWFVLFLRLMPNVGWLAHIGHYSYAIFLWHPLFGASAREMAIGTGPVATVPLATVSFAAAVGGPILLHRLAIRVPVAAMLLIGAKPDRGATNRPPRPVLAEVAP